MDKATHEVIMTALHERRNRLIQLDLEGHVNERSLPTIRQRINEVTSAINKLKKASHHAA